MLSWKAARRNRWEAKSALPWSETPPSGVLCSYGGPEPRHPVERALQEKGRRHPIDDFGPLGAGNVLRDQRTDDSRGRKPLIPKDARAPRKLLEIAREGAGR